MQAWMWRLTDDHAVIYTDDRATLKALFAYSRFPHQDLSRATTYERKNGRVFAWQFTFPVSAWNGVVRCLGRASITMLDQERWISAAEAVPPTPLPIEPPKKGKKASSTVAVVAKEEVAAAKRARKQADRPSVDLTQPLQPMSGVISKPRTAKSRNGSVLSVEEPRPQTVGAGEKVSGVRKPRASNSVVTAKGVGSLGRPDAQKAKSDVAATEAAPSVTPPSTSPRKAKPASVATAAEPVTKPKPEAKAKADTTAKAVAKSVPLTATAGPMPVNQRPTAAGRKASVPGPPPESRQDADVRSRRSKEEERLLAELAEVQLRLAALSEAAPPASPRRSGRSKATAVAAPVAHGVKGEQTESLRGLVSAGGRRKAATTPEPILATASVRGGAASVAVMRDIPATPTPRKRGPKPRQKQD